MSHQQNNPNMSEAALWGELSDRKPDNIELLKVNKGMVELILLNTVKEEDDDNGEA